MSDFIRLSEQISELQGSLLATECFLNSLCEAPPADSRPVVQAFYASESEAFRAALHGLDRARSHRQRVRARRAARLAPARRARGDPRCQDGLSLPQEIGKHLGRRFRGWPDPHEGKFGSAIGPRGVGACADKNAVRSHPRFASVSFPALAQRAPVVGSPPASLDRPATARQDMSMHSIKGRALPSPVQRGDDSAPDHRHAARLRVARWLRREAWQ